VSSGQACAWEGRGRQRPSLFGVFFGVVVLSRCDFARRLFSGRSDVRGRASAPRVRDEEMGGRGRTEGEVGACIHPPSPPTSTPRRLETSAMMAISSKRHVPGARALMSAVLRRAPAQAFETLAWRKFAALIMASLCLPAGIRGSAACCTDLLAGSIMVYEASKGQRRQICLPCLVLKACPSERLGVCLGDHYYQKSGMRKRHQATRLPRCCLAGAQAVGRSRPLSVRMKPGDI
jgi:hypothetical protein